MKTINIYIVKYEYEYVFMTFFDGMIYMRHASIVFTVFSYTSVLVFLRPLDGHIDIDQSHVLGHMMIILSGAFFLVKFP